MAMEYKIVIPPDMGGTGLYASSAPHVRWHIHIAPHLKHTYTPISDKATHTAKMTPGVGVQFSIHPHSMLTHTHTHTPFSDEVSHTAKMTSGVGVCNDGLGEVQLSRKVGVWSVWMRWRYT